MSAVERVTRRVGNPRLTVRCEYPDTGRAPTEVTFGLSPRYGILTARDAHGWFLWMMRFEVETNQVFALERRLLPMEPQCAQREFHDRKPRLGIGASLLQAGYTWSKIQHCHRLAQSRQHCFALSM